MKTMNALRLEKFGEPATLSLQDIAIPEPGSSEVLVEVHAGHSDTGRGVGVHDAMSVIQAVVDSRMHCEAGGIHRMSRSVEHIALQVDLHEVARRHLAVVQSEWLIRKCLSPLVTLSGSRTVMWL